MGLRDRPYWRDSAGSGEGPAWLGNMRFYWPRPTRAVVALMIACGAVFVVQNAVEGDRVRDWLALEADKASQAWRLLTFQFLHDGPGSLFVNLVALYFFGPPLEKEWGAGRFLAFYLACGVAGGGAFLLMALGAPPGVPPPVGASGGVLACVAACAVLMPQMRILVIPIRWATAILVVIYVLSVAGTAGRYGYAAIGDAAHLGGMLAGAAWAILGPGRRASRFAGEAWDAGRGGRPGLFGGVRGRLQRGAWQRKQEREDRRRAEVDRILDKVHREGIGSLSGREKKTLQDETRRQKEEDGSA